MQMGLTTLLAARSTLWNYGSNVPYATATADERAEFDNRLNQVTDRYINRGNWFRCFKTVRIPVYDAVFTLPRECSSVLGCDILDKEDETLGDPQAIYGRFYEYQFGGYGKVDRLWMLRGIVPFTDVAQTFKTPTGTFKLKATGTDTANVHLIGGLDANGVELFPTVTLPIGSTTTQTYTALPRIQKPVTDGAVSLYSVDNTSAVETLIAIYAPGETVPAYKAYKVPQLLNCSDRFVQAYCQIAHVPAVANSDIVNPGAIGALKMGLKALQYEDKSDDRCDAEWARGEKILDSERQQDDTDTIMTVAYQHDFGAGSVVNVY